MKEMKYKLKKNGARFSFRIYYEANVTKRP